MAKSFGKMPPSHHAETAATTVVIPYLPRTFQREVHAMTERARFGVLVCHRRFGKTVLAVNHLIKGALLQTKPRPRYGYIAPTYTQGKATSFDYFRHYADPVPGRVPNLSELRIDFPNTGQVRIYGGDNPDSLRGLYFDGVVLDEYGLHPAKTFSEVIGPTLVDRGGSALFLGTPNGKNQFYDIAQRAKAEQAAGNPEWFYREFKASQTGLLDAGFLASQRAQMTDDEYAQEFECSFDAAVKGAIYSKELEAARSSGRIGNVPYDPALPVDTDWDLGVGDAMAIWFSQSSKGGEIRLIDYHEASGEGFPYYVKLLRDRPYLYGTHWAPHDIVVRELGSGKSRLDVAAGLGLKFSVVPRITGMAGVEIEEGIAAARLLMGRCWFDQAKCAAGIEALMGYRRDYNARLNEFKATPVHDHNSHAADAFRGLAVRYTLPTTKETLRAPAMPAISRESAWMVG
jgi:phage terminase large subunit